MGCVNSEQGGPTHHSAGFDKFLLAVEFNHGQAWAAGRASGL